jgi:hypothetical protein
MVCIVRFNASRSCALPFGTHLGSSLMTRALEAMARLTAGRIGRLRAPGTAGVSPAKSRKVIRLQFTQRDARGTRALPERPRLSSLDYTLLAVSRTKTMQNWAERPRSGEAIVTFRNPFPANKSLKIRMDAGKRDRLQSLQLRVVLITVHTGPAGGIPKTGDADRFCRAYHGLPSAKFLRTDIEPICNQVQLRQKIGLGTGCCLIMLPGRGQKLRRLHNASCTKPLRGSLEVSAFPSMTSQIAYAFS